MQIRKNTFKEKLSQGQKTYGMWNTIPHPYVAEICAGAGFDWIVVDAEHGPYSFDSIVQNVQAIQSHDVSVIVRVPSADPVLVKRLADFGVQSILTPMIEDAQEADLMSRAMLYPPAGIRGVGAGLARAAQWKRIEDYIHKANNEMCCIVQIETHHAMQSLDDILEVEGLDVLLFGPADLAASMGFLDQSNHPEVVNTIKKGIHRVVEAGKQAGFLSTDPNLIREYTEAGARMIGVGADALLLTKSTSSLADSFIR